MPGLACPSDLPRLLEGRDVRTTTKNSIERSSNFPVKPQKEAVTESCNCDVSSLAGLDLLTMVESVALGVSARPKGM